MPAYVLLLTCAHCGQQSVLCRLFQSPRDALDYWRTLPSLPTVYGEPISLHEAIEQGAVGAEELARLTGLDQVERSHVMQAEQTVAL